MKKSALLAVSALSLGVVGLATFTPMVNAVPTTITGNATVAAKVASTIAIGDNEPVTPGQDNPDGGLFGSTFGYTFEGLKPGQEKESDTKTLSIKNNTGRDGSLSVKAASASADMNSATSSDTIPAVDNPSVGNPGWGIKADNNGSQATDYKAVPTSGTLTLGTDDGTAGDVEYSVQYKVATASDQREAEDYTATITYVYTVVE